jgi:hypothetical protein
VSRWGRHPDGRITFEQGRWLYRCVPPTEVGHLRVIPDLNQINQTTNSEAAPRRSCSAARAFDSSPVIPTILRTRMFQPAQRPSRRAGGPAGMFTATTADNERSNKLASEPNSRLQ